MEKIKGFRNSNILTEEGIKKTNLIIKEDYIYSVSSNDIDGLIELDDKYIVIPGLIDEHIHGTNGVDVIDGNEIRSGKFIKRLTDFLKDKRKRF